MRSAVVIGAAMRGTSGGWPYERLTGTRRTKTSEPSRIPVSSHSRRELRSDVDFPVADPRRDRIRVVYLRKETAEVAAADRGTAAHGIDRKSTRLNSSHVSESRM